MAVVSDQQIAQYIRAAGATDTTAVTMVAIALAESGGNTTALGDIGLQTSTWGPSVGLWQIRSLNAERGKGTTRDQNANMDGQTNANHAMQILNSQGLSAWSTYTSQAYRLFSARANSAVAGGASPGSAVDATPVGITGAFSSLTKIFSTLTSTATWLRIGAVGFGAAALYIGLVMMIKSSGAYETLDNVANQAAKAVILK